MAYRTAWTDGTGGIVTGQRAPLAASQYIASTAPSGPFDPYAVPRQGPFMGPGGGVTPGLRVPYGSVQQWSTSTNIEDRDQAFERAGFSRTWGTPPALDGFRWDPERLLFVPVQSMARAGEGPFGARARAEAYRHYGSLAARGSFVQPYRVSEDASLPPWRQWALRLVQADPARPWWEQSYRILSTDPASFLWKAPERAVERDPELEGKTMEEAAAIMQRRMGAKYSGDFQFAPAGTYTTADGRTVTSYGPQGMRDVRETFTWEDWIRDPTLGGRVSVPQVGVNWVAPQLYSRQYIEKYGIGSGGWQRDPETGAFREGFDKDEAWAQRVQIVQERKRQKEEEAKQAAIEAEAATDDRTETNAAWDEYVAEMEAREADNERWRSENLTPPASGGVAGNIIDIGPPREDEGNIWRPPQRDAGGAPGVAGAGGGPGSGGPMVSVPGVVGASYDTAMGRLNRAKLRANISWVPADKNSDRKRVLGQRPKAGTAVAEGEVVTLDVGMSKHDEERGGVETVEAPTLVGRPIDASRDRLRSLGLRSVVTKTTATDSRPGFVYRQSPPAGSPMNKGESVHLVVGAARSSGASGLGFGITRAQGSPSAWSPGGTPAELPSSRATGASGLAFGTMRLKGSPATWGKQAARRPSSEVAKAAQRGPAIEDASNGPGKGATDADTLVLVPNVVGSSLQVARALMRGAGLGASVAGPDLPNARVVRQSPAAYSRVNPGRSVTLDTRPVTGPVTQEAPIAESPERRGGGTPAAEGPPSGGPGWVPGTLTVPTSGLLEVPNLLQMSSEQARARAEGRGFRLEIENPAPNTEGPRIVLEQFPTPGARRPRGAVIHVQLSEPVTWGSTTVPTHPERPAPESVQLVEVPDILGWDGPAASQLLRSLKLTPWATGLAENGIPMPGTTVSSQNPEHPTRVSVGTRVEFGADARSFDEGQQPAHKVGLGTTRPECERVHREALRLADSLDILDLVVSMARQSLLEGTAATEELLQGLTGRVATARTIRGSGRLPEKGRGGTWRMGAVDLLIDGTPLQTIQATLDQRIVEPYLARSATTLAEIQSLLLDATGLLRSGASESLCRRLEARLGRAALRVRHLDLWSRLIEDYVALELAAETNLLFVGPTGQYSPYAIAYYENLTEHANGVYREIQDLSSDDFKSLVDRGGRSAPDGTWIGSSQPSRREWLFGKATERVLKIHDRAHDAIENVVNHASDLDRNVRSFALAAVMGATLLDVLQGFNVIRSVQRAVNSALTVARGIRAAEAAFRTTKTTQQLRLIFNRARGHFNELRFMRLSGQQLRQQGKVLVSKPYVRVRGTKDYAIPDYGVFDPKTGAFELLDAKRGLAPLSGPQRKVFESALRNGEIELFGQQAQELIDAMTAFQARSGRQVLEPLVAGTASGARQARVSGIGVWRYRSLDDYGHEPVTLGSLTAR